MNEWSGVFEYSKKIILRLYFFLILEQNEQFYLSDKKVKLQNRYEMIFYNNI